MMSGLLDNILVINAGGYLERVFHIYNPVIENFSMVNTYKDTKKIFAIYMLRPVGAGRVPRPRSASLRSYVGSCDESS